VHCQKHRALRNEIFNIQLLRRFNIVGFLLPAVYYIALFKMAF
jgi:hypothetical protein